MGSETRMSDDNPFSKHSGNYTSYSRKRRETVVTELQIHQYHIRDGEKRVSVLLFFFYLLVDFILFFFLQKPYYQHKCAVQERFYVRKL